MSTQTQKQHSQSQHSTPKTGGLTVRRPPAGSTVPSPPGGWNPDVTIDVRGYRPHKAELALMPAAVGDLRRFDEFEQVFGKIAPPIASVLEQFGAANEWSMASGAAGNWRDYVAGEEAIAWSDVQILMARMKPAFELAITADPSIAERFPALKRLLEVRRGPARRAAANRNGNAQDEAEGRQPSHGKKAARRKRVLKAAAALAATPATGATAKAA